MTSPGVTAGIAVSTAVVGVMIGIVIGVFGVLLVERKPMEEENSPPQQVQRPPRFDLYGMCGEDRQLFNRLQFVTSFDLPRVNCYDPDIEKALKSLENSCESLAILTVKGVDHIDQKLIDDILIGDTELWISQLRHENSSCKLSTLSALFVRFFVSCMDLEGDLGRTFLPVPLIQLYRIMRTREENFENLQHVNFDAIKSEFWARFRPCFERSVELSVANNPSYDTDDFWRCVQQQLVRTMCSGFTVALLIFAHPTSLTTFWPESEIGKPGRRVVLFPGFKCDSRDWRAVMANKPVLEEVAYPPVYAKEALDKDLGFIDPVGSSRDGGCENTQEGAGDNVELTGSGEKVGSKVKST